jgi:hypothetical protein
MAHATTPSTFTRRSLLKTSAVGAGLSVLAGIPVPLRVAGAGQIEVEAPPPATPGAVAPAEFAPLGPTIASKAAELEFDVEKIFRFVADEVRYESYAGALRGANGTLWSLAGNSVDKALLLAALLDEALVDYRFAMGALDSTLIEALAMQMELTAEALKEHYDAAFVASVQPPSFGRLGTGESTPEPEVSAEATAEYQEMAERAAQTIPAAQALAESQAAIIAEALAAADVSIPELAEAELPAAETDRHVWIQVADGTTWVDYLPAIGADGAPIATETFNELPDDLRHMLTIKLVAEEYIGGKTQRRDVATLQGAVSTLVNVPVGIVALPPGEFEGIGHTISQAFTGDVTLVPVLIAGDTMAVADVPIVFGGTGEPGGVLDSATPDAGPGERETLALWLSIDIVSPDADPFHVERAICDRLGAERRLQEEFDVTGVEPVKLVDFSNGTKTISELASAHVLTVDVARLQAMYGLADIESARIFGPIAANGPGMTAIRDALRVHAELPAGYQSLIVEPQLTLSSISLVDPSDPDSAVEIGIDLLRNSPRVLRLDRAEEAEGIHPAILAGVYDQVAEQVTLGMLAQQQGIEGTLEVGATVSSIFSVALENDVPIQAVTSTDDLDALQLGPVANAKIEQALANGWYVIVPVRSVEINSAERSGWWLIDPLTGQTRDQLDDGRSHASLVIPTSGAYPEVLTGRAVLNWIVETASAAYRFVGRKALCIFMLAGAFVFSAAFVFAAANAVSGGGAGYTVGAATAAWSGANAARQAAAAC